MNIKTAVIALIISSNVVYASESVESKLKSEESANQTLGMQMIEAAKQGDCKKVEELLKKDRTLLEFKEPENGVTPLIWASIFGKTELVKYLLMDQNANLDAKTKNDFTSLEEALCNGHLDVATLLLLRDKKNIDQALRKYIEAGRVENPAIIDLLRLAGANINGTVNNTKLIHYAAAHNKVQIIEHLLKCGASINELDQKKLTPLLYCCTQKNNISGSVDFLLKHGAKIDVQDGEGATALHWAAYCGNMQVVRKLLDALAPVNIINKKNRTPIGEACYWNNPEVVKLLLSFGANPHYGICDNNSENPSMYAESYRYLLEYGAALQHVNGWLTYANDKDVPEIMERCLTQDDIDQKVICEALSNNMKKNSKNAAIIGRLLAEYRCSNNPEYEEDCLKEAQAIVPTVAEFGDGMSNIRAYPKIK